MATEGKYGVITASNKQFHPGEPVFIFRATDPLAPEAIREYADLCNLAGCDPEHVYQARWHADRIEAWQQANKHLVKPLPD